MANILTNSQSLQSSSAPIIPVNQLIYGGIKQQSSNMCVVDLTPPTFSGINFLDVETRGQIRAGWAAGTDITLPVRYEIYIQPDVVTNLFNTVNIVAITPNLQYDIFTLPNGSFLQNGTTYYVGVRAIDGVGNRDGNTVSLNVISTGILTSTDTYECNGVFTVGPNKMFQGTMWLLKNSELATGATLGVASYQVYDKNGNIVAGMNGSGIIADSNGQFKITPVASTLDEELNHYVIKISITMDSEIRHGYVGIVEKQPSFRVNGQQAFDTNSDFIGKFWVESESHQIITDLSRLGNGSYDILDKNGNVILGVSESGIVPNADGIYTITPVSGVDPDALLMVTGRITVEVDGVPRTTLIPVNTKDSHIVVRSQFSINALNQFQATLWVSDDSNIAITNLGAANYTVYDAAGNAVAGLTQSGITADVNGRFQITPVSAALLTDLTHYNVKIGIVYKGIERIAYKGFSLLGN